jgi:hypothetical protein
MVLRKSKFRTLIEVTAVEAYVTSTRQMHRDLKLQHALLQQVARKVGVSEEATADMRRLVDEAPEGAPIAALLRTPPLTIASQTTPLTHLTAEADKVTDVKRPAEKQGGPVR